jgi:hypothetical protein
MADEMVTRTASMQDNSPLADRPKWIGPRDLQEVFGIGRTKAFTICQALPHIYIGRSIRVNKKTLAKTLIEKGRLP